MRPFTQDNENKMFIPDPATKKGKGRRQTRRIRNGMDESEASKAQKRCSQCGSLSHNYKSVAGCPLLLQLWSYERLAVGRPLVSHEPYHGGMYGEEEDERPTMGTIWIWRQVRSQQI